MIEKIIVAVLTAAITGVLTWLVRSMKELAKKINLVMVAQQQGLRHDLMQMYHTSMRWGCISDDDAELFEALYNAYHNLGQNGVMTSRYEDIMDLRKVPYYGYIEKEEKEKQNHNK